MTTEEAKIQIEYRKDFATPEQIEALDMGIKALDKVEKYQQAIHDIKIEINTAYASSFITRSDGTAFACGLELAFDIINKYTERVKE